MRSPAANRCAPSLAASTRPTIMWPITSGSLGSVSSPFTMWRSVRQTAQTETRMRTSPRPGDGTGSSTRRRGSFAARSCIALIGKPLGGDAALELGLKGDGRGRQGLRNGTVLLRLFGEALEGALIDARDVAFGCEIDARDAPSLLGLIEVHGRRRSNFLRLVAGLGERAGEGHGKAAGMRRVDQRIGHAADRLELLAAEVEVLQRTGILGEAVAADEVVVEIFRSRPHAADVERHPGLERLARASTVIIDADRYVRGDGE